MPNTVPLVPCAVSTSLSVLYDSTSPLTNPISGVPKTFSTLTKEPILNLVVIPESVSKSLALFKSI